MLTHFSLFSGIGGIDLASEWAGFTTVGQCEWADYPTKVLEKHWPDVPRWRDVRDVTAESIRERGIGEITLLSGGFPCQPHSLAGKRQASADERDLWPEFRRVVSEVTPKWVLGENVPGLFSSDDRRFFGRILNDLAQMGYSVGWATYGANDVGANHKRDRVFIVAHSNGERLQRTEKTRDVGTKGEKANQQFTGRGEIGNVANASSEGLSKWGQPEKQESTEKSGTGLGYQPERCGEIMADTNSESGLQNGSETCPIGSKWNARNNACWSCGRCEFRPDWWSTEPNVGRVANGIPSILDGGGINEQMGSEEGSTKDSESGAMRGMREQGQSATSSCKLRRVHKCSDTLSEMPQGRTSERGNVGTGQQANFDLHNLRQRIYTEGFSPSQNMQQRMSEYLRPTISYEKMAENWVVEPDIPRVATGINNRVDRLKCLGNAVVPQQVYPILKAIADIERRQINV